METGWSEAQHEDAHKRIHDDLERTASTLSQLAATVERNYNYFVGQQAALQLEVNKVAALAMRPIDGTTVVWTTKALATIFSAALIVVGALVWVQFTLQAIDSRLTAQSAQIADLKKQREDDKKENMDRLSQFLNMRLNSSLDVVNATVGKGAKK